MKHWAALVWGGLSCCVCSAVSFGVVNIERVSDDLGLGNRCVILEQKGGAFYFQGQKLETLDPLAGAKESVAHYDFACAMQGATASHSLKDIQRDIHAAALLKIVAGFCAKAPVDDPADSVGSAWKMTELADDFGFFTREWGDKDVLSPKAVNVQINHLQTPVIMTSEQGVVDISKQYAALRFGFRCVVWGDGPDFEAFQGGQDLPSREPKEGDESGKEALLMPCVMRAYRECFMPQSWLSEELSAKNEATYGDEDGGERASENAADHLGIQRRHEDVLWLNQPNFIPQPHLAKAWGLKATTIRVADERSKLKNTLLDAPEGFKSEPENKGLQCATMAPVDDGVQC